MAARVLLLGILFTEVLRPVCPAGVRANGVGSSGNGNGKNGNKGFDNVAPIWGPNNHNSSEMWVQVRPSGDVILGRDGLTLTCRVTAVRVAEIEWLYDGRKAPPCGDTPCSVRFDGSLRLLYMEKKPKVDPEIFDDRPRYEEIGHVEKHEYRCIARTYNGSVRSAPSTVLYPELGKKFRMDPEDDHWILEGEVLKLSCSIHSVPFPPNITWIHNGTVIPLDVNETKYVFMPPDILYIKAVEVSDDGLYWCIATNPYLNETRKSDEILVTVEPRKEFTNLPTSVVLFPQSTLKHTPSVGTDVRLVCAASGYPIPTTMWHYLPEYDETMMKTGRPIQNSTTGFSILELKNITASDSGQYTCSVVTQRNATEVQAILVEVREPPRFVKKLVPNLICPNGRTARFVCQVKGFPKPNIYWLKDAEPVVNNGRMTFYVKDDNKVELAISSTIPSDTGIYQCIASNSVSEIWSAGRLYINASALSPKPPIVTRCEPEQPLLLRIHWVSHQPKNSSKLIASTVHYQPTDGGQEDVMAQPLGLTPIILTKLLRPYTNYTLYVRLWNQHGPSNQSNHFTCLTSESVPTKAPKISATVINNTKINVTWKPLTTREAQGIVTEYKLEWRIFQHPSVRVRHLSADEEQTTLSDLIPGERYQIRVLARTKEGWPAIIEPQREWRTVNLPASTNLTQAQTFVINSTSIKVKWNIKKNSAPQFTSWKIDFKSEDGTHSTSLNLTKDVTEYIFTDLESKTYLIDVCALNFEEAVDCISKFVDFRTGTLNDAPISLEAVPTSTSSIKLTWFSGSVDKLNLFEVCYHPVHFLNETSTCIPVNSTTIIISNLKEFTLYQFKVKAINKDTNENSYSETIECYTSEDVPGQIEDSERFLVNSTKVQISWKKPKSTDEKSESEKSAPVTMEDKQLGIILGVCISFICIILCICAMYCRNRYEAMRIHRESQQPFPTRIRNPSNCCADRASTSTSQPMAMGNEIELAELCPATPASINPICDAKGGHNGGDTIESCVKEPLLNTWETNPAKTNLHITENPQYKPMESEDLNNSQQQAQRKSDTLDVNTTQLTNINHELDGSEESLSHKLDFCMEDGSKTELQLPPPTMAPMLEPNG